MVRSGVFDLRRAVICSLVYSSQSGLSWRTWQWFITMCILFGGLRAGKQCNSRPSGNSSLHMSKVYCICIFCLAGQTTSKSISFMKNRLCQSISIPLMKNRLRQSISIPWTTESLPITLQHISRVDMESAFILKALHYYTLVKRLNETIKKFWLTSPLLLQKKKKLFFVMLKNFNKK